MHDVEIPATVRRLIDLSSANCERLVMLVDDILDLDKIALGQMRLDLSDQSLAAITQRAVLVNEAYARKVGVSIVTEAINPDIVAYLDAERFIQVLSNLLSNAA